MELSANIYGLGLEPKELAQVKEVAPAVSQVMSIDELRGRLAGEKPVPAVLLVNSQQLSEQSVANKLSGLPSQLAVIAIGTSGAQHASAVDASVTDTSSSDAVTAGIHIGLAKSKRRFQELRRAQIEAVGQLAGGVAHDFNNLLTVVLGNLELIEITSDDPKVTELAGAALAAAESGTLLTQRLGNFSNRTGSPGLNDLNQVVDRCAATIRQSASGAIEVRTSLCPGEIVVYSDPARLETVLSALADNAMDAMKQGGKIILETSRDSLDTSKVGRLEGQLPARYATVTIRDAGEGMTPDTLARSTDLFFSTRGRRRDAGIGLSVALAYMEIEGGTIAIESIEGEGTAVHCVFPLPESEEIVLEDEAHPEGEKLKVLLLDDDDLVKASTEQLLKELGHDVKRADSALDALRALNLEGDFDLVLSDVHMPGDVDGVALAKMIRDAFPRLSVLLFSGSVPIAGAGSVPALKKPFTLAQLSAAIREARAEV